MRDMAVTATAPTRIDLAGGTLDIWPLNLMFDNPVTLNMAIDISVTATVSARKDRKIVLESVDQKLKYKFTSYCAIGHGHKLGLLSRVAKHFLKEGEPGVNVKTVSRAPAGAGLAGSSALNIALCGAFAAYTGVKPSRSRLIDTAKDIEAALLRVPTGLQDYAASVYGFAHAFTFPAGGMERERLAGTAKWLARNVLLFYSGKQRVSGINNWEMIKRVIDKDRSAIAKFKKIARFSNIAHEALGEHDFARFQKAVDAEWKVRGSLFPSISTPVIDKAIAQGKKAGAGGAKICGAGGGGCFFMLAEPARQETVIKAVEAEGPKALPFAISKKGLQIYHGK
ncbi:D,D-heptose 7-phosphate kinase [hydrothermal vent metagenome]|uniref:D,D-heptose 7-phosphate kinase n=1 Tax=hydrothermal vent metagenome TaxID=652676 RepID=A0A3B1BIM6_9ZZZZ